ncbi:MAG: flippase-like domain-containing protein [Nitrospirae bacterium]|nr:flippase-like domain-containing protein [Nitrospirota bacterium]
MSPVLTKKAMEVRLKKILFFLLKLSISACLLYFALSRAGVEKVFSLLRGINPIMFLSGVLIYIVVLMIAALRWRILLIEPLPIGKVFSLYFIGAFFNTLLPGIVGGDVMKIYYLYKETGKGTQTFASIFMDRYIGFACLIAMGLIALPFGLTAFRGSWVVWLLPLMAICFVLVSIIVFGLRLGRRFKLLSDFYGYFHSYIRNKTLIAKAILISVVFQILIIIGIYILSEGLGQDIRVSTFFIAIPIIASLASLPISIAGIGVREASAVLLLGAVGVKPDVATAISFAWFLIMAVAGLVGLLEYMRYKVSAS